MHEAAAALDGENPPKLLDVRAPEEFDLAHIENARMFTQELNMEMSGWPRDTPILFTCHGCGLVLPRARVHERALHGGRHRRLVREINSSIPRYEIERDPGTQQGVIRPLNQSFQK